MAYLDRLFPRPLGSMPPTRPTSDGTKKRALPFKAPRPVNNGTHSTAPALAKSAKKKKAASTAASSKPLRAAYQRKPASTDTIDDDEDAMDAVDDEEGSNVNSSDVDGSDVDGGSGGHGYYQTTAVTGDLDIEVDSDHEDFAVAAAPKPTKRARESQEESTPMPPKLLTRLLHEGFEDKDMRIAKDAMAVVGKYMYTFVREALARAALEREQLDSQVGGEYEGFLQVDDLERLAPQLLLDF